VGGADGSLPLQGAIAITDYGWYAFLSARPQITELNFWTPSARAGFRAEPFSPFLFKLKSPHNAICGFAFFAQYSRLPDWLAWETFGAGNGCESIEEMRQRIQEIRSRIRYDEATGSDEIGCIQLVQPTFFSPAAWVPQPSDWRVRTQRYARYDLSAGEGARVWGACLQAAKVVAASRLMEPAVVSEGTARYGSPQLVSPRLGQGTFRVAVLEAYSRACCVTGEHSLPALDASHIRPYASSGPHEVRNGLLFRADLHRLFDKGYVTVTPELRLKVGSRLREEFHNGRTYYPLHGSPLHVPEADSLKPSTDYLRWHNEHAFLG
jgi:putative restriction endonuclease